MNRKDFIKNSSLTAALFCAPGILKNVKPEETILGHNNKRYKLNTAWSKLQPEKNPVKDCHEMVQDAQKRIILLTNETANNVIIYDKSGKLIKSWGHEYPGAHGLTLFDENGEQVFWICDNNLHKVFKTTLDGRVLMTLDYPVETGEYTKEEEFIPTETAIAANGDIYVVDGYGKDFITQYDAKGNYIRHFGGRGDGDKYLVNAHGICIDNRHEGDPTLVVTSRIQNAFKRYKMNGEYIETIPLPGAWVCRPVINGDYLYTAVLQTNSRQNEKSGFVLILDKDFKVVSNLGGNLPAYGDGVPEEMHQVQTVFQYPHDVCIDDEGSLYIAQWNSGHVYPYKLTPVS